MTPSLEPVVQADSVSKIFARRLGLLRRQHVAAVDRVSLVVAPGEILGLVGESGCGKTTLARMLVGLERPSSGRIAVQGRPVADLSRLERARAIQMVYQDPYSSLNPVQTVGAILGQVLAVHAMCERRERLQRVEHAIEQVGLPTSALTRLPRQLSGGQRQRVAIARALLLSPALVVCDEPTSALDVSVQAQILNLLLKIREKLGLAYLFVSHNLAVVEHMANRVAVMYAGRIVELNTADTLFHSPRHPYTRLLISSVPSSHDGRAAHFGTVALERIGAYSEGSARASGGVAGCAFRARCAHATDACSDGAPPLRPLDGGFVACHHPLDAS